MCGHVEGQVWGVSSVVERWIPVPAVGGSIPSSLTFCRNILPLTHMPAESAASWEGMELGRVHIIPSLG